jgi:putative glutamine amidotransferase
MPAMPRIAVILDENTSGGGRRYEAAKGYFRAIRDAGGLPFGVPYFPEVVDVVLDAFDGVLSTGGRFAYPPDWYVEAEGSKAPPSERFEVERAILLGALERSKPILGICAGMQMLACLNGCRLTCDLRERYPEAIEHDRRDYLHPVTLEPGSALAGLVRAPSLLVNSFHREAVVQVESPVTPSAHAADGVIEAIEVAGQPFAFGLQWHQELLIGTSHPGDAIFAGFVEACS